MKALVVDGNNMLWRALSSASGNLTHNGKLTGGVFGFLNVLRRALYLGAPFQRAVVCWDSGTLSDRRLKVLPTYKGTRATYNPEVLEAMSPADREAHIRRGFAFQAQLDELKPLLNALGVVQLQMFGREADDLIKLAADLYAEAGGRSVIVSADKDLLQLVGRDVDLLMVKPKTRSRGRVEKMVTLENFEEEIGFANPERFLLAKCIEGDAGDNVPGAHGVGAKTAAKAVDLLSDPEVDQCLAGDLDRLVAVTVGHKSKMIQRVGQPTAVPVIETAIEVIKIDREEFDEDCRVEADAALYGGEGVQLTAPEVERLFRSLGFASLLKSFHGWVSPFRRLRSGHDDRERIRHPRGREDADDAPGRPRAHTDRPRWSGGRQRLRGPVRTRVRPRRPS